MTMVHERVKWRRLIAASSLFSWKRKKEDTDLNYLRSMSRFRRPGILRTPVVLGVKPKRP